MRLATIIDGDTTAAAILDDDTIAPLPYPDVGALLASGPDWEVRARESAAPSRRLDDTALAPPVTSPDKIFCVGLNYATHIAELGREPATAPALFAKFSSALVGPTDDIVIPHESEKIDWEAELVVVIGAPVRRARGADARSAIAGYAVLNDISVRDYQRHTSQFLAGKTWERSTPIGPALVTLDELDDPQDLAISCAVDGEVMQSARTSDLLFGPVELVEYISTICTLQPGDLIATGTPGGVGAARTPPRFLTEGSMVTTSVEGVGTLTNRCVVG